MKTTRTRETTKRERARLDTKLREVTLDLRLIPKLWGVRKFTRLQSWRYKGLYTMEKMPNEPQALKGEQYKRRNVHKSKENDKKSVGKQCYHARDAWQGKYDLKGNS